MRAGSRTGGARAVMLGMAGALGAWGWGSPAALAGGTPENVLIVIDPTSPESMYIGNYYKHVRKVPDANVIYIDPDAPDYAAFSGAHLDALFGTLRNAGIDQTIHYIVVTPGNSFFVSAPGYVNDACSPVKRFSMSSVFTMAFLKEDILAGGVPVQTANGYFSTNTNAPLAFSSQTAWLGGSFSTQPAARRYYIGAMLGYTGANGNTLADITALIDRSAAADGTLPGGAGGTFYLMNNTADPDRNVRAGQYPSAAAVMQGLGGAVEIIVGALPLGKQDILGIVTGFASGPVESGDMTITPGAFCDHLTSWAAMFDNAAQTKVSSWIKKGASGTAGTVEEPCNYTGKFPHTRLHAFYMQGMSLGEAYLRSAAYVPFQALLYGDPITRPFAHIPVVMANAPTGVVSGVVEFSPQGTTAKPGAFVLNFDLLIDGVRHSSVFANGTFKVDTKLLADGWHDVRVLGYDSTATKTAGRSIGSVIVNNDGRSASVQVQPATGDLNKVFTVDVGASGGAVKEVRMLHNGRVVAARKDAGPLFVWGYSFGPGPVTVQAEALFADGKRARSAPAVFSVKNVTGSPSGLKPVTWGYTKKVLKDSPALVELPASMDTDPALAVYSLVSGPSQATAAPGSKGYRVITPKAGACGTDQMVFSVQTSSGTSNNAVVTIEYDQGLEPTACLPDFNGDGKLNIDDFIAFQLAFALGEPRADLDGNCVLNIDDFIAFQLAFAIGCP